MKIIRFSSKQGQTFFGVPTNSELTEARVIDGDLFGEYQVTERVVAVDRLLAPFVGPLLGIGCNYKRLATHLGVEFPAYPVLYFSLPNAINDPGAPVYLPRTLQHEKTKYEGELVVVIGKKAKNVSPERALDYVFGYSIGNDVCTGEWQGPNVGGQWAKGKGFDGYKPLGPAIVTADEIPDPSQLQIVTQLNEDLVQDESVSDMIHDVRACISFLSQGHTLMPGDLIYTGTPFGTPGCHEKARMLRTGDVVSVTIDPIGTLTNPIEGEPESETT